MTEPLEDQGDPGWCLENPHSASLLIGRLTAALAAETAAREAAERETARWKLQSDDWQKRGWELGARAEAAEQQVAALTAERDGLAARVAGLEAALRRVGPLLCGMTAPYPGPDGLSLDDIMAEARALLPIVSKSLADSATPIPLDDRVRKALRAAQSVASDAVWSQPPNDSAGARMANQIISMMQKTLRDSLAALPPEMME